MAQPPAPDRYSRQVRFTPLGEEGQARIESSRVAVVGVGALGTFHAEALARSGAGFLRLVDRDYVELSNLQRQWLFQESDAEQGLPKAAAAARRLSGVNSSIAIEPAIADLTSANIEELLGDVDLVLDGTDNFETRYLINDWCVREKKRWIYGAAVSSYGLAFPVLPGETACLTCLYPEPPAGAQETCETAGVLNTVTAAVAAWQVSYALRILSGRMDGLARKITTFDVWSGVVRQAELPGPVEGCRACGRREFIWLEGKHRAPVSLCGRNAVQIHERNRPVNLGELAQRLEGLGEVRRNEFALRFFTPPYEITVFPDGRAILKGTQDVGVARSLYARYVGA